MKLIFADRHAQWSVKNGFNVFPALQISLTRREDDLGASFGVEKRIEIDIHFSFLFFWSYLDIAFTHLGKIEE